MIMIKKALHIALLGYGKMGRAVEKMALSRQHVIKCRIDSEADWLSSQDILKQCDIAIEFSLPETAPGNIRRCLELGIPVVSGTTGWDHELESLVRLCEEKNGCLLHASNFSIGVNFFFEMNRQLARMLSGMKGYSPRIVESHHKHKLDAPSGTAISLARDIIEHREELNKWAREGKEKEAGSLPIKSYRMEDVIGTHVVVYDSEIDSIEIKHTSHDRRGFAEGALLAAEWVHDKQGVFTMKDFLNI